MILYKYIAPEQGQTTPLGRNFWCQEKALITLPICCRFKKNALKSDFIYIFFHVSPYVYSPGQGQTIHWGQNFDDNRKAFSLCPYVASFKMISSKSDFIYIFHDFIHAYSPGAGVDKPLGTQFWCQQEHLITSVIWCMFQKNLFEAWFYTIFFHDFIHVYSPGAGADSRQGTKFWCQQRCLVTSFICCKFQKNVFEVWFYTISFHDLIHV